MGKKTIQKHYRLTPEALLCLETIAKRRGQTQTAILEDLLRYEWEREKRRKPPQKATPAQFYDKLP